MGSTILLVVIILVTCSTVCKCNTGMTVENLHIRTDIASRFATTLILSDVRNILPRDEEVNFSVVIPEEAFITNFSMTIDSEVYNGKVKEKAQAKKQYETAKRRGQSAGLVQQKGRETNKFTVSVNVAANTTVKFKLSYQELLRRKLGMYDQVIYFQPGQIVPDMKVDIFITETKKISQLNPPFLQNEDKVKYNISQTLINWLSDGEVHIAYYPTVDDQAAVSDKGLSGLRLVVRYDVERSMSAGEVMAVDGYFVHFIAPKGLTPIPKRIVFVLDSSGSMRGRKMEQVKMAMLAILQDLRPEDKFNIIDFDSGVILWRKQMVSVSQETLKWATNFVRYIEAGGATGIEEGMKTGLNMLLEDKSEGIPMIMFLTDGDPTVGIMNHDRLADVITDQNNFGIRIMSLAFGRGASYSLLQQISGRNHGVARKIYEDADPVLQLEGFYDEISTPILSEVKINYLGDSVLNDTVTVTDFNTMFEGSEIIISGKFSETPSPTFDLSLAANVAEGNLVLDDTFETSMSVGQTPTGAELSRFTERMWAFLTIKQLLEQQPFASPDRVDGIREKATQLSLKYGFVTPFTSLVVTKPQSDEELPARKSETPKPSGSSSSSSSSSSGSRKPSTAYGGSSSSSSSSSSGSRKPSTAYGGSLSSSSSSSSGSWKPSRGYGGSSSSSSSSSSGSWKPSTGYADSDPHFVMALKGLDQPICFDVMGQDGDVFKLISDPISGIEVDGKVFSPHHQTERTFFGAIIVKTWDYTLKVTPRFLIIDNMKLKWKENMMIRWHGKTIGFIGKANFTLHVTKATNFVIINHKGWKTTAGKATFLGFYLNNAKGLSNSTNGLLGEFRHKMVVSTDFHEKKSGSFANLGIMDLMTSAIDVVKARLRQRPDIEHDTTITCWEITDGALASDTDSYLVHRRQHRNSPEE